jgi:hypothetical protein
LIDFLQKPASTLHLYQPCKCFCHITVCCCCAICCLLGCCLWTNNHSSQNYFALNPRFRPSSATLFQTLLFLLFYRTQTTIENKPTFSLSSQEHIAWIIV